MKNLFLLIIVFSISFSCKTRKNQTTTETSAQNEVWEHGTYTVTGQVKSVILENNSQKILLKSKEGKEYTCVVSITGLEKNSNQYRLYKVGETITFRGEMLAANQMLVRQVLENF